VRKRFKFSLEIILFTLFVCSSTAFAISIENSATSGYITGNSNWTGVVEVFGNIPNVGTMACSGVLVAPDKVLTAGHCVDGVSSWQAFFETPTTSGYMNVVSSALHPLFGPRPSPIDNLDQYDLGILTLSGTAPAGATIYAVKTTSTGIVSGVTLADIVGWGYGGNPTVGFLARDVRRWAQNIIDGLFGTINGVPAPDQPIQMSHTFGSDPVAQAAQGLILPGDSGGGMFVGGEVVGIASFANVPTPGTSFPTGAYSSGHTRLYDPEIAAWLTEQLSNTEAVPEPGTWALVFAGLGVLWVGRWRLPRN